MPNCCYVISKMGPSSLIVKQDFADMFYSFKLHPSLWTYMGFRHPLTGQSYLMPVLPMGFTNSQPLECQNSELMASIIQEEMRALWRQEPGLAAFADLPSPEDDCEGVEPASTVYCDDFMQSATPPWVDLLVEVGARVFELMNVRGKVAKREGPSKALVAGLHVRRGDGALVWPPQPSQRDLCPHQKHVGARGQTSIRFLPGAGIRGGQTHVGGIGGGVGMGFSD